MPDQAPFHVDEPEGVTPSYPTIVGSAPDQPENSPVDHEQMQADLADALGVKPDAVQDAEPDPLPEQRTQPAPPIERNPSWAGEAIPSPPPRAGDKVEDPRPFPVGDKKPGWMDDLLQKASAEQEKTQAGMYSGDGQTPQPGPGPFAEQAKISQRIKRAIGATGETVSQFPEVEIEGFHIIAQIISQIMTSDPAKARELWMRLGKHCDDVAAALR